MEATKLIQAIEKLKSQLDEPKSHLEIVRDSILKQLAAANKLPMPEIFTDTQRRVFVNKLDMLEGFLESDDGADAVELLVNSFEHYCENYKTTAMDTTTEDDD